MLSCGNLLFRSSDLGNPLRGIDCGAPACSDQGGRNPLPGGSDDWRSSVCSCLDEASGSCVSALCRLGVVDQTRMEGNGASTCSDDSGTHCVHWCLGLPE